MDLTHTNCPIVYTLLGKHHIENRCIINSSQLLSTPFLGITSDLWKASSPQHIVNI